MINWLAPVVINVSAFAEGRQFESRRCAKVSEPFIGLLRASDRRRVSHPPMVRVSRVLPFCLRYPARHGQHFYGATTKYYPPVHPTFRRGRSCTPGSAVLYCRVYSATAFKHSLVGFPPRAPLLRVVELLPLPLRAGGFHRACWADVLCASSHHHSIYGIVSHAPAMIPPLFAGLPDASSPLPRLCWPGL